MLNKKHMYQVHVIWAWAFDNISNDEVKHLLLGNYIKDMSYYDPVSAQELSILVHLYTPRQTTFGDQLEIPIDHEESQTRI